MAVKEQRRALIALGSNLGDRIGTLASAVAAVAAMPCTKLLAASRLYETTPVGPSTEPFMNAVIEVSTCLRPSALMELLSAVEVDHGRDRRTRWAARTLDLDLLLYLTQSGTPLQIDTAHLTVPHPRMLERDFVLAPLADLSPTLELQGTTITAHLTAIPPAQRTIQTVHPTTCYVHAPSGG